MQIKKKSVYLMLTQKCSTSYFNVSWKWFRLTNMYASNISKAWHFRSWLEHTLMSIDYPEGNILFKLQDRWHWTCNTKRLRKCSVTKHQNSMQRFCIVIKIYFAIFTIQFICEMSISHFLHFCHVVSSSQYCVS